MKTNCPSCGAENAAETAGVEVVCWSCFHVWTPAEAGAEPADGGDGAEEPTAMLDSADLADLADEATAASEGTQDGADSAPSAEDAFFDAPIAGAEEAAGADDKGFDGEGYEDTGDLLPAGVSGDSSEAADQDGASGVMDPGGSDGPAGDESGESTDDSDTSFLFRRRRHRSLSQTDVAVIGTYQRQSAEMPQSDDIVWNPGSTTSPRTQPEQPTAAPGADSGGDTYNPFGDTEVVWGEQDDGGGGGGGASAWGTETGVDTSGEASSAGDDPFAVGGDSAALGDSGATKADDPFGDIDSGGFGDDPFASNPFAADDEPFGGGGDDNLFSTADFAEEGDGFDDFGFASLDDGGGGDGGDFGGGGPDAGAGDHLELEIAGGGDGYTDAAGPQGVASPGGRRRRRRDKSRGKKKGGSSQKLLAAALVVLLVGAALGQTDMGYFGINLLLPAPSRRAAQTKPLLAGTDGQVAAQGTKADGGKRAARRTGDAPADFARSIDALKRKLASPARDKATQQQLVSTLLRCKERHPEFFASKKYGEVLEQFATKELLSNDLELTAQMLLADGKRVEAQAALMQYISTEQNNPEILYLLARITLQNKDEEGAIGYYKATLAIDPKHQAALYDLGKIHLQRKELAPARVHLGTLLEANSLHSGAKLAMAQITLYEKGYDQAKTLIEQALSAAKNTQNDDEQFRAFWLKAMLAEAQQNLEDKGYALGRALELRPSDERTALELAGLLNQQGKHPDALRRLQQCQKAGGDSARFYEALVRTYAATNDPDSAKSQLNEGLRKHPKDTGLLMLQAEGERLVEHYKTAKSIYASIIENDPGYNHAYQALATLQFQEGRQQEAVETLSQGASIVEEKLPILEKKAEFQMKIGATLRAKETMGQILTIDPNNTDVKLRFATLLKTLGYEDEAARYYSQLQVAGALTAENLLHYGEVLIHLKRYDEAFKHVEAVIATDPLNLRANILRGAVHSAKGEYKVADEDLRKALKVNSESADAFYHLGRNEMAQGNVAAAVEFLAKASSLAAGNNAMRAALAQAYTEVGGIDNARKALGQYTKIISDYERYTSNLDRKRIDADIYFRRGRLYYQNNQFREALKDFRQAMILDQVRGDALIEFARTLNTMGKRSEAEAYLKEILTRDPKNPAAHYEMGEIALKGDRRTQAEDHFKQAIASGGANFPTAHRHLGYLYQEKGLTTLSCNAFKEYLRVAPKGAYDREEIARQTARTCR